MSKVESEVNDQDFGGLVVISTFRSTADAQIAKGVLQEAGIESMLRADNAGGMYPALGGTDLLVRTGDVRKARESLSPKP